MAQEITLQNIIDNLSTQRTHLIGDSTTEGIVYEKLLRSFDVSADQITAIGTLIGDKKNLHLTTNQKIDGRNPISGGRSMIDNIQASIETESGKIAIANLIDAILDSGDGIVKRYESRGAIISAAASEANAKTSSSSYSTPTSVAEMEALIDNVYTAGGGAQSVETEHAVTIGTAETWTETEINPSSGFTSMGKVTIKDERYTDLQSQLNSALAQLQLL